MSALEAALPPDPGTALDFGCGSGWATRMLLAHGWQVTAVDFEIQLDDHDRLTKVERRVPVEEIRELGEFDLTIGLSVLHHFPDWRAAYWALRDTATEFIYDVPGRIETDGRVINAEIAPVLYDWATARDQIIGWTQSAFGQYSRPLLLHGGSVFGGTVVDGNGWTGRQWEEVGKVLLPGGYPGSLNVIMAEAPHLTFAEWTPAGIARTGSALLNRYPVTVCQMPEAEDPHLVEILAPVNLRETLKLESGDRVIIRP